MKLLIIRIKEYNSKNKANSGKISINSSQRDDPAGPSGSQIKAKTGNFCINSSSGKSQIKDKFLNQFFFGIYRY